MTPFFIRVQDNNIVEICCNPALKRLRIVNRMQAERSLRWNIHCGIGIIDAAHGVDVSMRSLDKAALSLHVMPTAEAAG